MLVDPEVLRAFAGQVDTASGLIKSCDVGHKVSTAADQLDGSTTQWAARLVGGHVTDAANKIANKVNDMGVDVRGAGDRYQVSDGDLAGDFKNLFS
jgi:Excreted virulence factor EspC, type VII ESX diderm